MPERTVVNLKTKKVTIENVELSPKEEAYFAAKNEGNAKENARQRIKDYAQGLILAEFDRLQSWEQSEAVLGTIVQAVVPAARADKLNDAIAVYQYARSTLREVSGWTRAEANAYNPATDQGWP